MSKLIFISLLEIFIIIPTALLAEDRTANQIEVAYAFVAAELRLPELCEKISPNAYEADRSKPAGQQIAYTRSKCFNWLAEATGDPSYCTKVREKDHSFLSGYNMAPKPCQVRLRDGEKYNTIGGDAAIVLRLLGFGEKELNKTESKTWQEMLYSKELNSEIKARSQLLPDFSKKANIADAEFFRQLACDPKNAARHCLMAKCLQIKQELKREGCLVEKGR